MNVFFILIRTLAGILVLGAFASFALAQKQPPLKPQPPEPAAAQTGSIRGRVTLESGSFVSEAVRVTLSNARGTQAVIYTDNHGRFDIPELTPSNYTLEIEGDNSRFEPVREDIEVRRGSPTVITVTLKEKSSNPTAKPEGKVKSVAELSNNVPPKARREFERASALAKEGKAVEAIKHLHKAIEVFPEFMMAHNDLGALLMEQGRLEEATAEFLRALEIDAKAFNPQLNLGIAFVRQQRFTDAVDVLRKAVSLDSTSAAARLYLGIALKGTNDLDSAERELRAAYELGGAAYADALFRLGDLYMSKGDRVLARQAFEDYLRVAPQAENAAQAKQLIGILR